MNTKIKLVIAVVMLSFAVGCARQNPAKKSGAVKAAVKAPGVGGSIAPSPELQAVPTTAGSVVRSNKPCLALVVPSGFAKIDEKEGLFQLGQDFRMTSVRGSYKSVEEAGTKAMNTMNTWSKITYGDKEVVEQGIDCVNSTSIDPGAQNTSLSLNTAMSFKGADWVMPEQIYFSWKANEKNEGEVSFERKPEGKSLRDMIKPDTKMPEGVIYGVYATPDKSKFAVYFSFTQATEGTNKTTLTENDQLVDATETKFPVTITIEMLAIYEKI